MAFIPALAAGGRGRRRVVVCCDGTGVKAATLCEQIRPLVEDFADPLGLRVGAVRFFGSKLSVVLNDGERKPTLDDCSNLSKILNEALDADGGLEVPTEKYSLEVSTAGVRDELSEDFEFDVFKGFHVTVTTSEPVKGKSSFVGTLQGRSDADVLVNQKGKIAKVPRDLVQSVRLTKEATGKENK
eukprot:Plantae.Rhodophyta-Purpureofilum_apyrenoidigerum.ctg61438.p2 GENE.Plantae.Rhodophyta-Purpureofilum_apyrenoidigerum.ctg61438~~Plantae.Rhodophyta-Purpureofilum_apyrenoidigerum.ctg61438.p2  ORF type:complete len:185 (+),score=43.91 Plantae.Rhodophyta-Purpureofilum_apyrenoidigerum.ctg61438:133-687(+)